MGMNVDTFRKWQLSAAEFVDAWRLVPRLLIIAYGYMVWNVVQWYMGLPVPTTQHAALVTTVVGISAAVMGLYTGSGRKWDGKFIPWNTKDKSTG